MSDPALGLPELLQGDPSAYIRQNNRNLVEGRFNAPILKASAAQSAVPTDADAGDMYFADATDFSATDWAGIVEDGIAIALSDLPSEATGWAIIAPEKGMLVHNGTDLRMYNGSSWTTIVASGAVIPDDFVFVEAKADLPTPAGGIITLEANRLYMFLTEIDLTGDRLVLGANTVLAGSSSENARIKSTGLTGTALITSAYSCPMRDISIEADVALDLDSAGDPDQVIDWRMVNFVDCPTVGTIEDFGNVVISDSAFLESANLTFDGSIGTIAFNGCLFNGRASQTTLIIPSTLTITRRFRVIYSAFVVLSGETGISVDASATIPVEGYILDTVNFAGGSSSYTSGVAFDDNKSLWLNSTNVSNSASIASMSMVGNATDTTISVVNTPVKVAGTTSAGSINQKFTHASNKLTYDGEIDRSFRVTAVASLSSGNNNDLSVFVYKNGSTQIVESEAPVSTSGSGNVENVTCQTITEMTESDYVEIWVENRTGTTDVIVEALNVIVEALN